jgi:hypothetical protein
MLAVTMASYYTSQAYDAPAPFIWSVLTDFTSWPRWFPRMTKLELASGESPGPGAILLGAGEAEDEWTRWKITDWSENALLVCEHVESRVPISHGIEAAFLQFELFEDPEGCTLEVELGADGRGVVGDFFVGMTLGTGARRLLPQLVDAFSDHVVEVARAKR